MPLRCHPLLLVCLALLAASLLPASVGAQTVRYEAEQANRTALSVASSRQGFSGTGYVTGFTNDTGSLRFTVNVPAAGLYALTIGYAAPFGEKYANLLVNGQGTSQIHLPERTSFGQAPAGSALLNAGSNTVTIEKGWGWYEIDYLAIAPTGPRPPHQATGALVNPQANSRALSLMSFLADNFGSKMISGQQESVSANLADTNYIFTQTGKRPALLGLDFMDYSPSRVERGSSSTETQKAINWWNDYGGIVSFCWHWNAPKNLIDEPGKEWWRGFYTYATTFDLAYAMANPQSEDYALLLRDIDAIAAQLKILQTAGVPILWRPLHEAEGGWFWWGAKGPGPCIALWRLMYDRMTNLHQLNNLIWVWNSVATNWYPGDEYVDIVSYDAYTSAYNYSPSSPQYESLVALSQNRKVIGLAENGSIPDPDLAQSYSALWSWFCVWNGHFIREWNSVAHLQHVYHHPLVITLDELPDLKTYQSPRQPIAEQLAGHWKLDETEISSLDVFNAAPGATVHGQRSTTIQLNQPAPTGAGYRFDGVNHDDFVALGAAHLVVLNATDSVTVSAWIKPDFLRSGSGGVSRQVIMGANVDFQLALQNEGQLMHVLRDSTGTLREFGQWESLPLSSARVPAGSFSHVALTRSANRGFLYLNGALVAQANDLPPGVFAVRGTDLHLGRYSGALGRDFDGVISDVGLWAGRALASDEISLLATLGLAGVSLGDPLFDQVTALVDQGAGSVTGGGWNWEIATAFPPSADGSALQLGRPYFDQAGNLLVALSEAAGVWRGLSAAPSPVSQYAEWLNTWFNPAEAADPSLSGPDADPAGDGISNLLKYAFNLDPRFPAPAHRLPQVATSPEGLTLSFAARRATEDLSWQVEVSADLVEWRHGPEWTEEIDRMAQGPVDWITVRAKAGPGDSPKGFIRLRLALAAS
jgi:mannan endo-1,4-beta-mannosidase